jgi:hypothetical protein
MSYTYLLDAGEESSAESFADIDPSALLRLNHTQGESFSNVNAMESYLGSPCGMMSPPSTENRGKAASMSSAAASRARTLAQAEAVKESEAEEVDCGLKWRGSFAKWDHDTSSWKTHQCSLLGGLEPFSETWPKWGMMRNGECSEPMPPVFPIIAPECGWLPTPTKTSGASHRNDKIRFDCLAAFCRALWGAGYPNPRFWERIMGWPTSWTDARPLETAKFQEWQRWHGKFSPANTLLDHQ